MGRKKRSCLYKRGGSKSTLASHAIVLRPDAFTALPPTTASQKYKNTAPTPGTGAGPRVSPKGVPPGGLTFGLSLSWVSRAGGEHRARARAGPYQTNHSVCLNPAAGETSAHYHGLLHNFLNTLSYLLRVYLEQTRPLVRIIIITATELLKIRF